MFEKTKTLLPGRIGVAQLASDLRNIAQVPNFVWDFSHVCIDAKENPEYFEITYHKTCGHAGCALGFAELLYSNINEFTNLKEHLDLEHEVYNDIFLSSEIYGKDFADVAPLDVADALENHLADTMKEGTA